MTVKLTMLDVIISALRPHAAIPAPATLDTPYREINILVLVSCY